MRPWSSLSERYVASSVIRDHRVELRERASVRPGHTYAYARVVDVARLAGIRGTESAGTGTRVETRRGSVHRGCEAGLLCSTGRRAWIKRRAGKSRKTGGATSLRKDEFHSPLRELQALMHRSRHGRRTDGRGHARDQRGRHDPRDDDEDDQLDQAHFTTSAPSDDMKW